MRRRMSDTKKINYLKQNKELSIPHAKETVNQFYFLSQNHAFWAVTNSNLFVLLPFLLNQRHSFDRMTEHDDHGFGHTRAFGHTFHERFIISMPTADESSLWRPNDGLEEGKRASQWEPFPVCWPIDGQYLKQVDQWYWLRTRTKIPWLWAELQIFLIEPAKLREFSNGRKLDGVTKSALEQGSQPVSETIFHCCSSSTSRKPNT